MAVMTQAAASFLMVPAPKTINLSDIRVGDTIKVSYTDHGVTTDRTGVVDLVADDHLSTAEDAFLWSAYWGGDFSFTLIDRPKPKLPTEEGAIILVPFEGYAEAMIFRSGFWEPLDGTHRYTEEWVSIREWKPAVVKPEVKL